MAFDLEFSGPALPCDFPGCTLDSFHDGDHLFAEKPKEKSSARKYHCVACGTPMVFYGDMAHPLPRLCESPECLLRFARHEAPNLEVVCCCPQRSYPHELAVHKNLRSESYNPKLKFRWPWSLALSVRTEPSTERKAEAA